MKNRLLPLFLLLSATGLVQADGMPGGAAAAKEAAAPAAKSHTRQQPRARKPARLPQGDLRHCLDLGSNQAIIRCAESPRSR